MAQADPSPMGWPAALATPESKLEPYYWYREKRAESPIHYDATRGCWDLFSYELVTEVLADPETYSSITAPPEERSPLPSMLSEDPPKHTELREPVEEYFRPGSVRSLAPEIERTTNELLDAALGDGRIDVVDDLAWPLPIETIAALLGVPAEDRDRFKQWSDEVIAGPALTGGDPDLLEERRQDAAMNLANYFAEICAERREDPRDDLVSAVLQETTLSDFELLGLFRLLLVAGNVTTTNLITNTLWCLLEADELDAARADEGVLESAIEEAMRFRSPVQRTIRRATRDVTLDGREVAADDRLVVWLGAANRDPARFEEPDVFDPTRSPNPHVAFGRGIHICLGAALARLEARIALATLLEHTESIEAVDTRLEPVASTFIYGVRHFPVRIRR